MRPAPLSARPTGGGRAAAALFLVLCTAALPAQALYKVVGPDGRVTYTDRPVTVEPQSRVIPLSPSGTASGAADGVPLPLELREAAARYPVTLYVVADCPPCDAARALLRERGIPHAEKIVATNEDADALHRLAGTRDAPTLTIGSQPLRGLAPDVWNAYLDSAGYPRQSRLPPGWRFPAATPLVERREAAPAAPAAPAAGTGAAPAAARPAPAPAAGSIRF